ncbi:MAG TPA: hypothetical protein PKC43_09200 [Phycisphaerales bacterium]|nr:hypothetical protein [Phycisphaerales bacterium]HMP37611.1 hypothetical protein [Phycisphaerales bacterium]
MEERTTPPAAHRRRPAARRVACAAIGGAIAALVFIAAPSERRDPTAAEHPPTERGADRPGGATCGEPIALLDESFVDLGEARIDPSAGHVSVERIVRAVNTTDRVVSVDRVVRSCACAEVALDVERLAPGEEMRIALSTTLLDASELAPAVIVLFDDGSIIRCGFRVRGWTECVLHPPIAPGRLMPDGRHVIELIAGGSGCDDSLLPLVEVGRRRPAVLRAAVHAEIDEGVAGAARRSAAPAAPPIEPQSRADRIATEPSTDPILEFDGWTPITDSDGVPTGLRRGLLRCDFRGTAPPDGLRISISSGRPNWFPLSARQ